jgi:di/tricarboxylate transporter
MVLANAIKDSGLHERISLKIIILFGSDLKWYNLVYGLKLNFGPLLTKFSNKRLLLGIMSTTSFLALWMANNTSAAIMMLPITLAVVKQLVKLDKTFLMGQKLMGQFKLFTRIERV